MDMRSAIKQITGAEPTDQQIQKVMAIAHALDMPANDPMIPVLAMLDAYHGIYTRLPDDVAVSVSKVSKDAATIAESDMVTAVAQLVPTVSKAVSDAAKDTVNRIQIGNSLWTVWSSTIFVGIILVLGFICGADVYGSYMSKSISLAEFWKIIEWSVACGLGLPTLTILSLLLFSTGNRSEIQTWFAYITGIAGLIMYLAIVMNLLQLFIHLGG